MDIASQYADVYTDFHGLSQLRADAASDGKAALKKVAGQFEALFIQMMLKSMRDANLGEGLMDSEHVKTYQSMFDQQIALDLSKRSGLGLAEMMVRQLSANLGSESTGENPGLTDLAASAADRRVRGAAGAPDELAEPATPASATGADWQPSTPDAFVRELLPHARDAAEALGTVPDVLIAQAALETGWGRHMIRHPDGSNSFNLFGIKADARWQGARALTDTVEFRDGLMRRERAPFRAYDSLAESFADYVDFLKSNPRYREVLDLGGNTGAYARALSEAGYATDPDYSAKIDRILNSGALRDLPSSDAVDSEAGDAGRSLL